MIKQQTSSVTAHTANTSSLPRHTATKEIWQCHMFSSCCCGPDTKERGVWTKSGRNNLTAVMWHVSLSVCVTAGEKEQDIFKAAHCILCLWPQMMTSQGQCGATTDTYTQIHTLTERHTQYVVPTLLNCGCSVWWVSLVNYHINNWAAYQGSF